MRKLTVGSLFSGIGGLDFGLEQTGRYEIAWQVEIDAYCQKVLAKHWPDVTRFRDVRTVGASNLATVDLLTLGFPCTDISPAGKRRGIEGPQSGLWNEGYRVICELRPRYVLVENSSDLLKRGMGKVLSDLARVGYDAEWRVLSAAQFGARHLRKRTFIVAYTHGKQYHLTSQSAIHPEASPEASSERIHRDVADTHSDRWQAVYKERSSALFSFPITRWQLWADEPNVGRVADGVSSRLDRLRGLGNAVVPQVAEWVGECIAAWDDAHIKEAHADKEVS